MKRTLASLATVSSAATISLAIAACGDGASYPIGPLDYRESGEFYCEYWAGTDHNVVPEEAETRISVYPAPGDSTCDFLVELPNTIESLCATVTAESATMLRASLRADPARPDLVPSVASYDDFDPSIRRWVVQMGTLDGTLTLTKATDEIRVTLDYTGVGGGDLVEGTPATARCIYDATLEP